MVKLAAQFAIAYVELKQAMTRCQRHALDIGDIPGTDNQAAAVGIPSDFGDDIRDLVNSIIATFSSAHRCHTCVVVKLAKVKERWMICVGITGGALHRPLPPLFSVNWSKIAFL